MEKSENNKFNYLKTLYFVRHSLGKRQKKNGRAIKA